MPFILPFDKFKYYYVQRNPDLVESEEDIYYKDPVTNLIWFSPAGPEGRSDGQSIPRPLWPLFGYPLQGSAIRAAFLHDSGYRRGTRSKKQVDEMFYHALIEDSDPHPFVKYLGVKLFGFRAWGKYRKNESHSSDL